MLIGRNFAGILVRLRDDSFKSVSFGVIYVAVERIGASSSFRVEGNRFHVFNSDVHVVAVDFEIEFAFQNFQNVNAELLLHVGNRRTAAACEHIFHLDENVVQSHAADFFALSQIVAFIEFVFNIGHLGLCRYDVNRAENGPEHEHYAHDETYQERQKFASATFHYILLSHARNAGASFSLFII